MQALIIAGGLGSRLMPLTADRPQAMLEIGGKTILHRIVKQLYDHGLKQFHLVLGHGKDKVLEEVEFLKKIYEGISFNIINDDNYKTCNNIYATWLAKQHIDDSFFMIDGDMVYDDAIISKAVSSSMPNFILVDNHKALTDDDVKVFIDSNGIRQIGKEVNPYKSHGIAIGFHKFSKEGGAIFFDEVDKKIGEGLHNVFYEEALEAMMRRTRVDALHIEPHHKWEDVDFIDEYEVAKHTFKD